MAVRLKVSPDTKPGKYDRGFPKPGNEAKVRADLDKLHSGKLDADTLRKRWGVNDLSDLHSWAYRPGALGVSA